jgi:hypothetical protein
VIVTNVPNASRRFIAPPRVVADLPPYTSTSLVTAARLDNQQSQVTLLLMSSSDPWPRLCTPFTEEDHAMASDARLKDQPEDDRNDDAQRTVDDTANEPVRKGDILGLSDAPPEVEIPQASRDRGGSPEGIDVRDRVTGTKELTAGVGSGATGIDMGAGGSGTDITSEPTRRTATRSGSKA